MAKQSGLSDPPALLSYPGCIPLDEYGGIAGLFCYVLQHYGNDGISCLVHQSEEGISVVLGDWAGNSIDLSADSGDRLMPICQKFLRDKGDKFLNAVRLMGIVQGMFFFVPQGDGDFMLVDIQYSMNKFSGPGMVNDVFGKVVAVPKIIKVTNLDDKVMDAIRSGSGSYAGSLVIKPSRARSIERDKKVVPLYVEVIRC